MCPPCSKHCDKYIKDKNEEAIISDPQVYILLEEQIHAGTS